eukprot:s4580_g1.t1
MAGEGTQYSTTNPTTNIRGAMLESLCRSLTASPSHERKPCRRGALRHRSTRDLRIREKKAQAVEAAPAAATERRACSRADVAAGEPTSGSSNARQALQKLFQSMQTDKSKSGSSESTSKLSETRKALCKLYESMQKRSSSS